MNKRTPLAHADWALQAISLHARSLANRASRASEASKYMNNTRTLARADPALHAKKESNQRKQVRAGQVSLASKPGNMQSKQRQ